MNGSGLALNRTGALLGARMSFGGYSIPALIEIAAKVACIVHVIRQGRSLAWIWLILLFPVGGPLIYFFVEIWPELGRGGVGRGFSFRLPQNPTRTIARLTEELEYSSTVEKRVQLARAYAAAGRHPEAVETIRACLSGVFKDDPPLTFELAEICFGAGLYQDSRDALAALDRLKFKGSRHERCILAARCHEKLGDIAAGEGGLRGVISHGGGRGGALSLCTITRGSRRIGRGAGRYSKRSAATRNMAEAIIGG